MFTSITSRIPIASVRRRGQLSYANVNRSLIVSSGALFAPNLYLGAYQGVVGNAILLGPLNSAGLTAERFYRYNFGTLGWMVSNAEMMTLNNAGTLSLNSVGNFSINSDVRLYRDAANIFAQRNGTSSQIFRVYNTYTDASNYERAFFRWNTNIFEIGTDAAGTGTQRQLSFVLGTATSNNPLLITQTFNNAAVNFTAIRLNVTDTTSASDSKLLDLQVTGVSRFNVGKDGTAYSVFFQSTNSVGDEGGEIVLAKPVTNSTISGSLTIDAYQNRFRIFETSGTNRGGYYDLTSLAAGAGTNLLYPGLTNGAVVNTSESTATTTYTDLATVGPSTTVTIGPSQKAIVMLHCQAMTATDGAECYMSFTGAGVAADDSRAVASATRNAGDTPTVGGSLFITGLTTGSQTFTSKYRTTAGTATYAYRNIIVIPI